MVTSFSMAKLVGFPTLNSTFTYQKGAKNTSLMDLLFSKGVVDSHFFPKSLTHFRRWCLVKGFPLPPKLPLSTMLSQQSKGEDIHPKWYFLI
jgi:hypothetical protein